MYNNTLILSLLGSFMITTLSHVCIAGNSGVMDQVPEKSGGKQGESDSALNNKNNLSEQAIPPATIDVPERPSLLLELGEPYLATGAMSKAITIPTGAVWRPALWVYGRYQTALQTQKRSDSEISEWSNRLDLFAHLRLSGTEKIVVGLRPLDNGRGDYTRYQFKPNTQNRFQESFDLTVNRVFFEGDFGEIFPNLDNADSKALDVSFSVGRQPLLIQEGYIINDTIDSIALSNNNIQLNGVSSWRSSFLYGWDEIQRGNNQDDSSAKVVGWLNEFDTRYSTYNVDLIYVKSDLLNSGLVSGFSAIQRLGGVNTNLRILHSSSQQEDSAEMGDGQLYTAEISFNPTASHDLLYTTVFFGDGNFTPAARSFDSGGPLANVGILFAAVGVGEYPPPLSNLPEDAVGGAIGYQHFFDHGRSQLIIEAGMREQHKDSILSVNDAGAFAFRYQKALAQNFIFQADVFRSFYREGDNVTGFRTELRVKF